MKEVDLPGGEKSDFIKELQKRAPVYCSRFGRQWDDNYVVFTDGRHWWRDDWERLQRDGKEEETEGKKKEWLKANWEEWLRPRLKARPPAGLKEKDQEKWIAQLELDLRRFGATNIAESVQAAMQRESNNLVQAVILVSDGRSTEGTPQALRDLRDRLNQAHVPIFTIAVGEDRPRVKIDVASPLAPQQTRPEDPFPVTVDIQGEGLADQEIKVYLDITNPKGGDLILNNLAAPKSDKPGTDTKDQKPEQISLGKKITFEKTVRFGKGEGNVPPHVEVEFPIDVIKLMERAGKAVEPGMKLELGEGEWMFEVRVPRDKNENFPDPEHKSKNPRTMTVIKRPLRILLFAGAPTRDYQFCRSLFVREAEKKRVELCVYLQPVPGQVQERANIVQDVAPEQLLKSFPKYFGGDVKVEDRYYNLEYYDLIIGFDPDWSQLMPDELNLVKKWVEQGGGLIVEGGPVNTLQLARPGESRKKLKPILDLYPVVPKDIRIQDLDRKTDEPWRLRFPGVGVETEYLKLDDDD